jgi:hypothetical protein
MNPAPPVTRILMRAHRSRNSTVEACVFSLFDEGMDAAQFTLKKCLIPGIFQIAGSTAEKRRG